MPVPGVCAFVVPVSQSASFRIAPCGVVRHLASQVFAESDVELLAAYSGRSLRGVFSPAQSG